VPDRPLNLAGTASISKARYSTVWWRILSCYLNALSQYYTHQKQVYYAAGSLMTKARDAAVNRALLSALTPVFDNLLKRDFAVAQPDLAYAGDVTYIWTQEGWLYLAVVIDLFSRKVVGWSMSSRMKAGLVCDALKMSIWRRRPKEALALTKIDPPSAHKVDPPTVGAHSN
jgi:transposase InsO family protein